MQRMQCIHMQEIRNRTRKTVNPKLSNPIRWATFLPQIEALVRKCCKVSLKSRPDLVPASHVCTTTVSTASTGEYRDIFPRWYPNDYLDLSESEWFRRWIGDELAGSKPL